MELPFVRMIASAHDRSRISARIVSRSNVIRIKGPIGSVSSNIQPESVLSVAISAKADEPQSRAASDGSSRGAI